MNTKATVSSNSDVNTDLAHLRPQHYNDEVDLGELLRNVFKQWKLIGAVTAAGAVLSVAVALLLPKVYEVKAIVSLPELSDLGSINEQNLVEYSTEDAFTTYLDELSSAATQKQAFLSSTLLSKLEEQSSEAINADLAFIDIQNDIKVKRISYDFYALAKDEKAPLQDVSVTMQTSYPAETEALLASLLETANSEALANISMNVQQEKAAQLKQLQQTLESLRESTEASRLAQIARMKEDNQLKIDQLEQTVANDLAIARNNRLAAIVRHEEALATAKQLNIVEPVTWDDLRTSARTSQITNELGNDKSSEPLYFQGSRILAAEIDRLKNRTDDSAFVADYAKNMQQIAYLKNDPAIKALENRADDTIYIKNFDEIKQQISEVSAQPTDFTGATLMSVSLEPTAPIDPIKPNKKLIAVAGTVLAGFLGLFIALIMIAVRKDETV